MFSLRNVGITLGLDYWLNGQLGYFGVVGLVVVEVDVVIS